LRDDVPVRVEGERRREVRGKRWEDIVEVERGIAEEEKMGGRD
jgi:hypothetical protein